MRLGFVGFFFLFIWLRCPEKRQCWLPLTGFCCFPFCQVFLIRFYNNDCLFKKMWYTHTYTQMSTSVWCQNFAATLSTARTRRATTLVTAWKAFTDVIVSTTSTTVSATDAWTGRRVSTWSTNTIASADLVSPVIFLHFNLSIFFFFFLNI